MNPISWIVFGGEHAGSASPAAAPASSFVVVSTPAVNTTMSNVTGAAQVLLLDTTFLGHGIFFWMWMPFIVIVVWNVYKAFREVFYDG